MGPLKRNLKKSNIFFRAGKNPAAVFSMLLLILFPSLLFAEASIDYSSKVDWKKGELEISVNVNYPPESGKLRMRNNSENIFDEKFFDIFTDSVTGSADRTVYFDSKYTMDEIIQHNPLILNKIEVIKNSAVMVYNVYHEDMTGVKMLYRINLFRDILPYFITHKKPHPVSERYVWVPNEKYTGVVIYAKGKYHVRGENLKSALNPSILPSVYSQDMEKILSAELVSPEILVKQGTAALTDSDDDPVIRERAGENPLYTMAEEIYGKNRTDVIVPSDAADLLFYKRLNEDLVREGRFVIITDLP